MNYKQIYKDISVVIVGDVNRDVCNPLNLYKHKVITQEEIASINDGDMHVGKDVVSFRAKTFELYCDSNRMQIRTEDSTRSEQIGDITLNILRLAQSKTNAIGINATFRFCLDNLSFLKFSHRCSPSDSFIPMADNAILLDYTFIDWNHPMDNGEPAAVYNIKRLQDSINNQKVIQISVNNHKEIMGDFNLTTKYLSETGAYHSIFFEKCHNYLKNI